MDNSLLVSLSQQLAASRAMDVIANNLANASTPGYKREDARFEQYLERVAPSSLERGPQTLSFVEDAGIARDTAQGAVTHTGATYDFAINGNGYFALQTPQGVRYTRDGHFSLNADGQIVNSSGYALLGQNGPVTITPDDLDVQVGPDGSISSTVNGIGTQVDQLRLVDFADDHALMKEGSNLYSTTQAENAATGATIQQGALEASNVQPVVEISNMIQVMRAYQATTALSQSQQQLAGQAIQRLGTMPN